MRLLRALLAVAYPFVVFGGLQISEPRWVALALLALLGLRAGTRLRRPSAQELRLLLPSALLVGAVLMGALLGNDARALLFVPALMNAALLVSFAGSLVRGPSLVETFARMRVPDLPESEVRYCRAVTVVWCVFFAANGSIALALALSGSLGWWTFYNGLVAYLLAGLVFAGEFVVRSWRFGRYEGTLVEPLFRRLFPHGPAT